MLGADQVELCGQLAGKGDRFAGVDYTLSARGAPLLAGALVTFECRLADTADAGDHLFVMGLVEAMTVQREGAPMLFYRGRYGSFAEQG